MKSFLAQLQKIESKFQNGIIPFIGFIQKEIDGKYSLVIGCTNGASYRDTFSTEELALSHAHEYLQLHQNVKNPNKVVLFYGFGEELE